MQLLYQGKAKQILATEDPKTLIVRFTDSVTAGNGKKRAEIFGKGALAAHISIKLFELLRTHNLPSHYIKQLDDTSFLAHAVHIIPLEVVVRSCAAGSLVKRLGIPRGTPLQPPLLELFYKSDPLGDPLICEAHALAMGLATPQELALVREHALRAHGILQEYFASLGLTLVDIKFEFGRAPSGEILLADELSPDTMRLWDAHTGASLDKDVFREDKADLLATYREVARRMGLL